MNGSDLIAPVQPTKLLSLGCVKGAVAHVHCRCFKARVLSLLKEQSVRISRLAQLCTPTNMPSTNDCLLITNTKPSITAKTNTLATASLLTASKAFSPSCAGDCTAFITKPAKSISLDTLMSLHGA